MIGEKAEKWRELCAKVEAEQDPRKFFELTLEITRLLREKRDRLMAARKAVDSADLRGWSSPPVARERE